MSTVVRLASRAERSDMFERFSASADPAAMVSEVRCAFPGATDAEIHAAMIEAAEGNEKMAVYHHGGDELAELFREHAAALREAAADVCRGA